MREKLPIFRSRRGKPMRAGNTVKPERSAWGQYGGGRVSPVSGLIVLVTQLVATVRDRR